MRGGLGVRAHFEKLNLITACGKLQSSLTTRQSGADDANYGSHTSRLIMVI